MNKNILSIIEQNQNDDFVKIQLLIEEFVENFNNDEFIDFLSDFIFQNEINSKNIEKSLSEALISFFKEKNFSDFWSNDDFQQKITKIFPKTRNLVNCESFINDIASEVLISIFEDNEKQLEVLLSLLKFEINSKLVPMLKINAEIQIQIEKLNKQIFYKPYIKQILNIF